MRTPPQAASAAAALTALLLPIHPTCPQAAHTPTIAPSGGGSGGEQAPPCALQLPKAASALAEGPLAMGVASSYKNDSFAQQMSLKEQHNPLAASSASAAGMARSSSGNPFSGEVGGCGAVGGRKGQSLKAAVGLFGVGRVAGGWLAGWLRGCGGKCEWQCP